MKIAVCGKEWKGCTAGNIPSRFFNLEDTTRSVSNVSFRQLLPD